MAGFLDYNATVVTPVADGVSIPVPQSPAGVGIATVIVPVPRSVGTIVELNATIGVRANTGTGSVLFRIFRDGHVIYYARQGIEAGQERYAVVSLQAFDTSVSATQHAYTLSIEKLDANFTATVIGPVNISGTVYGTRV